MPKTMIIDLSKRYHISRAPRTSILTKYVYPKPPGYHFLSYLCHHPTVTDTVVSPSQAEHGTVTVTTVTAYNRHSLMPANELGS